ncbi:lipocalin family protein [Aquimarina algicola]|uniref:SusE outer membrane protein domain-containing protein n=1 Tax=Aquimarina algicola TaxID=2589995 RepID=A0A504JK93_9FLAO|nr:lipocalin family protein [Aquimarina algicola]TPN89222.1 hypothetical protein FHK87_03070 [Aquimarina algicola]
MKNLFLFLAIFASVLVTSCSSDDDNTNSNPSKAIVELKESMPNISYTFTWSAATDADGDTVTYDFYVNDQKVDSDNASTEFVLLFSEIEGLSYPFTIKVEAKDGNEGTSTSNELTIQDPIISNWNFFSSAEVVDGVVGTLEEGTPCEKTGFVDFKADGTYITRSYIEDRNNECIFDNETNGTWENLGNNVYRFKFDTTTNEIPVSIEGNTLTITGREDSSVYVK